jgi:hypothetical protein
MEEIYTVEKETIKFSKPLNRNANDKAQNLKDSFSFKPKIESESNEFLLPEDQITVSVESREFKSPVQLFRDRIVGLEFALGSPSYLWSCYDEFSRSYLTLLTSKSNEAFIPLIKSEDLLDLSRDPLSRNVLQYYNPSCSSWFSTFNKVPREARHLLCGRIATDINILLKLNQCIINKPLEPVFGTMCLYTFVNDEFVRITETFYFDATELNIREKYSTIYGKKENNKKHQQQAAIHIADGSGSGTHLNAFSLIIPEEFKNKRKDIFLVVQLSKILSTDCDTALIPYNKASQAIEKSKETKHFEACVRLKSYRQPIGLGITKLIDEAGKTGVELNGNPTTLNVFFHPVKFCLNDAEIAKVVFIPL